jgi:hypothetical protein
MSVHRMKFNAARLSMVTTIDPIIPMIARLEGCFSQGNIFIQGIKKPAVE